MGRGGHLSASGSLIMVCIWVVFLCGFLLHSPFMDITGRRPVYLVQLFLSALLCLLPWSVPFPCSTSQFVNLTCPRGCGDIHLHRWLSNRIGWVIAGTLDGKLWREGKSWEEPLPLGLAWPLCSTGYWTLWPFLIWSSRGQMLFVLLHLLPLSGKEISSYSQL